MKPRSESQFDEHGCAYVSFVKRPYDVTQSFFPKLKHETLQVNVDVDALGHLIGVELIVGKKKKE